MRTAPPGYKWVKVTELEITEEFHGGPDCYPWTKVYAWLPVKTITGKYVWRKEIYKRKIWVTYEIGRAHV